MATERYHPGVVLPVRAALAMPTHRHGSGARIGLGTTSTTLRELTPPTCSSSHLYGLPTNAHVTSGGHVSLECFGTFSQADFRTVSRRSELCTSGA